MGSAGWLDPGSKLMDIGLSGLTPPAAQHALVTDATRMSVALHETTHFLSLENVVGHLMGFLAMRATTVAESIREALLAGQPVHPSTIQLHAAWHEKYRLLLEMWRPLLEGLAVYAQTRLPARSSDDLLEPIQLLALWNASTRMLGTSEQPWQTLPKFEEIDGGVTHAAYAAIERGPSLPFGQETLASALELMSLPTLRPYFLGHSYLRALQHELARKCARYGSNEAFFSLMMRVLRSSGQRLMRTQDPWVLPQLPRRIYGWIDVVRRAPAERVKLLPTLPDPVDVLQFLETGSEVHGYSADARASVTAVSELVPAHWREFDDSVRSWFPHRASPSEDPAEWARRLAAAWMRGAMSLNLSTGGIAWIQGWVERGLAPLHAVALDVEGRTWWLVVGDAELDVLLGRPAEAPRLDPAALRQERVDAKGFRSVLLDAFARYEPFEESGQQMPMFRYAIRPASRPNDAVVAEFVRAAAALPRQHLRAVSEKEAELHRGTSQLRNDARKAPSGEQLANLADAYGADPGATRALRDSAQAEHLRAANIIAAAERSILSALLGRSPTPTELRLAAEGVGVVPGAVRGAGLIAQTYAGPIAVGAGRLRSVKRINTAALRSLGRPLFQVDSAGRVQYCGLWGEPSQAR